MVLATSAAGCGAIESGLGVQKHEERSGMTLGLGLAHTSSLLPILVHAQPASVWPGGSKEESHAIGWDTT